MSALKHLLWSSVLACAIGGGCAEPDEEMPPNGNDGAGLNDGGPDDDEDEPVGGEGEPGGDDGQCWDAPEKCLQLLECASVISPDQLEALEAQYGEDGSCWCGTTEAEALACYETCVDQLANAIEQNPTEPRCHGQYCPIEELDPDQPYGPVTDGTCPNYGNSPQLALQQPFGLPGSVCSPKCGGIAKFCPDHPQTTADGTCYVVVEETEYCVTRCWVDPLQFGPTGTQCQCGARCQPFGGPDGEGNQRGICTFE